MAQISPGYRKVAILVWLVPTQRLKIHVTAVGTTGETNLDLAIRRDV